MSNRLDRETIRAASPIVDVIADLLDQPVPSANGTEVKFRCPWHEDAKPSLRINVGKGKWYCDPCGIGGDVFAFVQRLRGWEFHQAMQFLAERAGLDADSSKSFQIAAEYNYTVDGLLQYQTVRLEPKDFRQRRPDGHGGFIWDLKGTEPLLYQRDDLQGKKTVAVLEGEKDVDRARSLGIPATCNHGGAKKWKPAHTEQLVNAGVKQVVVVPDNDKPGREHAETVARSCYAAGLRVKVVELPDLPEHGDLSDWLDAGGTMKAFDALLNSAPLYMPSADSPTGTETAAAPVPASTEPVDLAALLTAIVVFVQRYVVMSYHHAVVVALWVAHTYAIEASDATPYLDIQSATPRAGKTRLLEVLALIAANAWFTARTSAAALIRKIDMTTPTLLYDERDATFKGDQEVAQALRGILNSGYKRGGASSQCVGVGAAMTVKDYQTFCPKALAGLGRLPDTVADRSISLMLRRRLAQTEPVDKFKARLVRPHATLLAERLATWARTAVPVLRDREPIELDLRNDRAEEVWEPLLSIAALASPEWLAHARAAAEALSGSPDVDAEAGVRLLSDIRDIFQQAGDPAVLPTKEITEALAAMEDRPWAIWGRSEKPITPHALARLLKEFEVMPAGELWLTGKNRRGYRRSSFEDSWLRYCAPPGPNQPLDREDANQDRQESENLQPLGSFTLADAQTQSSADKHGLPSVLAVKADSRAGAAVPQAVPADGTGEDTWAEV